MDSDFALTKSLNRLIAALNDTIGAYEAAAGRAHSFALYAEYEHDVTLRREVVRRLVRKVSHLGGDPKGGGTMRGWFKRALVHLLGIGLGNETFVLRLFEREERHVITCIRALVADRDVPPAFRRELATILSSLNEELYRLELYHVAPPGGTMKGRARVER
jgi:uncharacterized protein (TIGR02284 family)